MAAGALGLGRREIRALLARRGLLAQRRLGQNFLVDADAAGRLVEAARVRPDELVIEIGPGLGALTPRLAARAAQVIAIEVDAGLVAALREEKLIPGGVELLHCDVLDLDLEALVARAGRPVRVVGSLPYAIAGPLLRRLLGLAPKLRGWTVLLQREVAARLTAAPGSPDYGSLAVLHRLCTRVEPLFELPPRCFFPVPQVVSSAVRVTPIHPPRLEPGELEAVERVVRAAFGQRRKTLVNALRGGLDPAPDRRELARMLERLGIDARARAERIDAERLLALARALGGGERGE